MARRSWIQAAAAVDECLRGPLPDVVLTQGRHLGRHPGTPPQICRAFRGDDDFSTDLARRLEELQFVQCLRTRKYGAGVADEWPVSHTPAEIRTDYESRQHCSLGDLEAATPPGDDDDDDEPGPAGHCWWNPGPREACETGLEPGLVRAGEPVPGREKKLGMLSSALQTHRLLPTPPESHPDGHGHGRGAVPSPASLGHADLDTKDDTSGWRESHPAQAWVWSNPVPQVAGRKRRRDVSDLGDNDAGLAMRCGPRRSPYLRSGSGVKYLKAG